VRPEARTKVVHVPLVRLALKDWTRAADCSYVALMPDDAAATKVRGLASCRSDSPRSCMPWRMPMWRAPTGT
jgi:hypothetical protein